MKGSFAEVLKYENSEFLCGHKPPEHGGQTFKNRLRREIIVAAAVGACLPLRSAAVKGQRTGRGCCLTKCL
jgi:hypothetical protein